MYVIENKSNPHIQSQKITKWNHLFFRDKVIRFLRDISKQ